MPATAGWLPLHDQCLLPQDRPEWASLCPQEAAAARAIAEAVQPLGRPSPSQPPEWEILHDLRPDGVTTQRAAHRCAAGCRLSTATCRRWIPCSSTAPATSARSRRRRRLPVAAPMRESPGAGAPPCRRGAPSRGPPRGGTHQTPRRFAQMSFTGDSSSRTRRPLAVEAEAGAVSPESAF